MFKFEILNPTHQLALILPWWQWQTLQLFSLQLWHFHPWPWRKGETVSKGHLYSPLKQRENALKELALESSVCVCVRVCVCVCVCVWVQLCLTPCNPMDCSPLDSSVYGIFQAGILARVDCHFLLHGIFLIQGLNLCLLRLLCLLHWQVDP